MWTSALGRYTYLLLHHFHKQQHHHVIQMDEARHSQSKHHRDLLRQRCREFELLLLPFLLFVFSPSKLQKGAEASPCPLHIQTQMEETSSNQYIVSLRSVLYKQIWSNSALNCKKTLKCYQDTNTKLKFVILGILLIK